MVRFSNVCPPQLLGCSHTGVLWHNKTTGEVAFWNTSGAQVTGTTTVSWSCGAGCADSWRAVTTADFNGDGNSDILWYNQTTGQVAWWLLNAQGAVLGAPYVDWTCNVASGCASQWSIVASDDTNGDGNADVLWWNSQTGQLSTWLLDANAHVTGNPTLSRLCGQSDGCSNNLVPVGYMRFN
jgi:hypothetical protein